MPPKKKGNKKQQDDWENDIGETPDPIAQAAENAKAEEAQQDVEEASGGEETGGGLMAALRKSRAKKTKKGKPVEDFVEGENPADGQDETIPPPQPVDLTTKAPPEADMEEEDVFGQPMKKGKGGKAAKAEPTKQGPDEEKDEHEDDEDGTGRVKTKKEKEKEKKEREKQRKKEQVRLYQ